MLPAQHKMADIDYIYVLILFQFLPDRQYSYSNIKKRENCAAFLFHSFNRIPDKISIAIYVPSQKTIVIQVFCNV